MQEGVEPLFGILVPALAILISITTHEFSHGFAAFMMGDTTAKDHGRLTLNPFAHIDLIGTILLPGLLLLIGAPVFGWAKPVPFNPYNLSDQRYGSLKVGIAGPLANLVLFVVSGILLSQFTPIFGGANLLIVFLNQLAVVNFVLMMFNLIPVPPLDGSKVLFGILPPRYELFERWLEQYGFFILLAIIIIEQRIFPFISLFLAYSLQTIARIFGIPFFL